jgi:hypothetical protein
MQNIYKIKKYNPEGLVKVTEDEAKSQRIRQ